MESLFRALKQDFAIVLAALLVFAATLACFHNGYVLPAHWRDTPINWPNLSQTPHWVTGKLAATAPQPQNPRRVTLQIEQVTGYQTGPLPQKLSIGVDAHRAADLQPGTGIAAQVLLFAPDAPAYPGARDFRPFALYSANSGHGFVAGRIASTTIPNQQQNAAPFLQKWKDALATFRTNVAQVTQTQAQGVTTALLVGDTSAIPPQIANAYRAAGLSHLLAISGMQLSVAGLGVFWLMRRILASWPTLALTHNIRLYAAVVGLAVVPVYALVAGAGVSVVRAALMVSFFLLAVVAGRLGDALRAWAIALASMSLLWPESALTAGFQLSFAATLALILGSHAGILSGHGFFGHLRQIAIASWLAGLATLPLVAAIFGQVSLVGMPTNLIAVPLMGTLGTWLSLIVLALWPFGLGSYALPPLTWVCEATNRIALYAANLPQALVVVPQTFALPLAGLCAVALILCYARQWRWAMAFTLATFALAWAASITTLQPQMVILEGGQSAVIRTAPKTYSLLWQNRPNSNPARWAQYWGYTLSSTPPAAGKCDATGCFYGTSPHTVAVLNAMPTPEDCAQSTLILAPQKGQACPAKTHVLGTFNFVEWP